jgi:fructose/tagatose bisphosphate aldolase
MLESIRAVCDAAERTGLPVILQAGSSSYRETSCRMLATAALAAAAAASVPAGVHLDHSTDLDEVRDCLELGYTSVMVDGSRAYLTALATVLAKGSDDVRQLQAVAVTAMAEVAADKLTLLAGPTRSGDHTTEELR